MFIFSNRASLCLIPSEQCWPIQGCASSLFRTIKVTIGECVVTSHEYNYALINYMKTITGYSDDNRDIVLDNCGWYRDTTGEFDSFEHDNDMELKNEGAQRRLERFAIPDTTDKSDPTKLRIDWQTTDGTGFFIMKLESDFSNLDLGVIPGIAIKIEFSLNSDDFYLMAPQSVIDEGQQPTMEITTVHLKLMGRELPSDNFNAIMGPINKNKKTIQTFTQMRLSTQDVRMGGISWNQDNFLGSEKNMGQRVFLAFVRTAALSGSYQLSPFNWTKEFKGPGTQTCAIKDVIVSIDVINFHLDFKRHTYPLHIYFSFLFRAITSTDYSYLT